MGNSELVTVVEGTEEPLVSGWSPEEKAELAKTNTFKKIALGDVKDSVHGFDSISKKGNVFTFRRGFFYSHGSDGDTFGERMLATLCATYPQASWKVAETDMVWKPFRGGASVRASSHYMAKIEQVG